MVNIRVLFPAASRRSSACCVLSVFSGRVLGVGSRLVGGDFQPRSCDLSAGNNVVCALSRIFKHPPYFRVGVAVSGPQVADENIPGFAVPPDALIKIEVFPALDCLLHYEHLGLGSRWLVFKWGQSQVSSNPLNICG